MALAAAGVLCCESLCWCKLCSFEFSCSGDKRCATSGRVGHQGLPLLSGISGAYSGVFACGRQGAGRVVEQQRCYVALCCIPALTLCCTMLHPGTHTMLHYVASWHSHYVALCCILALTLCCTMLHPGTHTKLHYVASWHSRYVALCCISALTLCCTMLHPGTHRQQPHNVGLMFSINKGWYEHCKPHRALDCVISKLLERCHQCRHNSKMRG